MKTMVILADVSKVPCPQCGSQDVERTPLPSEHADGKESVDTTCSGCGLNRGDSTRSTKGRPKRTGPLVYPKGETAPHHTAAPVDYYLLGNNGEWEARCASCGFRARSKDKHEAEGRIGNHVRCHKSASKTAAPDDIQKVKDAINHCDAYDSVSMWLDPQGNITVVDWHGGESAIYSKFDRGYVRLHWDPRTFIVHFKSPLTPAQGVALFTLLEAVHMPEVTVQSPSGGVKVDQSRNPSSQMKLIRSAMRKTATPSPQDIKAACWSKGFFELMAKEFGARGNDPVHGACRLVMEALKIIFPSGEKMATILDRGTSAEATEFFKTHQPIVQHYVLKIGNMYLDGNGAHTAQDITTDEELGGWREIPNLIIPATQQLIDSNRGIACPPGAAQRAAQYILDYKG
jgi:predicted small metal-binding protein